MDQMSKLLTRSLWQDRLFNVLGFLCTWMGLLTLLILLGDLALDGAARINWQFLTAFPSRFAHKAGILSAWVGTLLVMLVTAAAAIPLGIAAAVYLEEYAGKNRLTGLIEINIANLAGVPSIIYGLMALGLFVYKFRLGESILTAGLTLGFLVLPIIIVATRESLRSIPAEIREASYSQGATKWQTVWNHLLPYASGGIATGIIIALSRAIGETAPLITIGALTFIAFLPPPPVQVVSPFFSLDWVWSQFTVLPIQMFNWVSRPQKEFHFNAAATGLILMLVTLSFNALAIFVRYRMRRRIKW